MLFTDRNVLDFPKMFGTTFIIACFTCAISLVFVLSVAYCMSRMRFRVRKTFMNVVLILGMFPGIMAVTAIYFILKALGLSSGTMTTVALILVYSAGSGAGFYVMKGYMDTIPTSLDEAALRELMEEMKRDGIPINGFLDRCRITITGQNITVGVCHGTKFLQEMEFERLLAERVAAHTGVRPKVTLTSAVGEAEQRQMEEKLERKIAPPVVKFEKKNTAPSIKVEGLDLTDKPVTIFHGKMFTPKNLTPLKDLGGEGGKCTIWGDVFFSEVKGNFRKNFIPYPSPIIRAPST